MSSARDASRSFPRGLAVFVLEDSDEDFETLETALRDTGIVPELRRALTGDGFLDLLRGRPAGSRAASMLVLIDLNTPGLDGGDVLHDLKADEGLRTIPVVVLTTSSSPHDIESCYAAGANAYHVKPFDPEAHQAVVRRIMEYWLIDAALPRAPRSTS